MAATSRSKSRPPRQHAANNPAIRMLMQEFQQLQKEPNEGFQVKLLKEDNLFEWDVAIFGPPETVYAGGYFRAVIKFPPEYPFSPPSVRFVNKIWHPNVYDNGTVCISILHPATNDTRSGELPCERWNPTQNAHSVIMSIISLLNEPNTNSPANVDASVMYRRWREQGDKEYERIVREQVEASKAEADKDGVRVPTTVHEYCVKQPAAAPPGGVPSGSSKRGDFHFPSSDLTEDMEYEENEDVTMHDATRNHN
ncbi:ubiquitin-conjugating enzyme E2 R2-like [Paramacrobiotus metropolitanus]|uniref:ubiquitin-conjugating enzyme E2 R2-like n=1 Tax=Paramacrobiotus metropolitanus TaxID=2943436 RepID=UPI002445DD33|nr:ubiquitin-conjugating enzyme E2 R2-like [Paramacrobiotus metropolitanus]